MSISVEPSVFNGSSARLYGALMMFFRATRSLVAMGLLAWATGPAASADQIVIENAQASLKQDTAIASPISGMVQSVGVREGSQSDPGQSLIRFEDSEAQAEFVASRAAFEAARVEADNDVDARYARRTFEVNQRELQQSEKANQSYAGAVSGTEIEKLRLTVDQAALAIEQAEHERNVAEARVREKSAAVKIATARLSKHHVKSPVSGMVAEISVEPGEWVEQGTPLMRIITLDPLRVECFIDGRKFGQELVDRPVTFALGFSPGQATERDLPTPPNLTLTGVVTFVSPELNSVTGQTRLWAELANPDGKARAGMQGKLTIDE